MPTDALMLLRAQLARVLNWEEAHVGFDKSVTGIPPEHRGTRPAGFEHSPWELLEHMRIAQKDLLDFATHAGYVHTREWPADYWPRTAGPANTEAWDASIADFTADREKLKAVIADAGVDLLALVPTGQGSQTYLRTIMLVVDHNAYHLGQLVAVRRAIGIWP